MKNKEHINNLYELFEQQQKQINELKSLLKGEKVLESKCKSVLTGSELCKAMLARGDVYIMCKTSNKDDNDAIIGQCVEVVTNVATPDLSYNFESIETYCYHAVPIDQQGNPLTSKDVGL